MRHLRARSTLYCGFSVLGGPAGRTLTSDGGGVLLSISSDAKALTIRWRAYEVISILQVGNTVPVGCFVVLAALTACSQDGRLAAAVVSALQKKLAPRMSQQPSTNPGIADCC